MGFAECRASRDTLQSLISRTQRARKIGLSNSRCIYYSKFLCVDIDCNPAR
jgi:hypothetical protein